jgi:hypothetical protein
MSKDIAPILQGWDHDPDEIQVRIIAGDDGRDKIQMRLDLGVIQLELAGRPDGLTPHGKESLLDWHESKAADDPAYRIESSDCEGLMREGVQYYQRYLASFHLHRFDLVVRDTTRNLRLFAFVVKHAENRHDWIQFDRFRPYVTMMRARALAMQALDREKHGEALQAFDDGIAAIRDFLREYDQEEESIHSPELNVLVRLRREVETTRPVGPEERLEQQMKLAISLEDFEEAARLRDQLARLKGPGLGESAD